MRFSLCDSTLYASMIILRTLAAARAVRALRIPHVIALNLPLTAPLKKPKSVHTPLHMHTFAS